ncbi:hypothetical protein ACIRL2_23765 [Embleya sp. NPDC127516]|uniref:hypothetical protein n=1 Tax=Embleya sp. NPDC127516 TaxID=3363990 RepID=UPI00381FC52D
MADEKTTKHTCNGGRGPTFGRKTAGCPRCDELIAGAKPVVWRESNKQRDARIAADMRTRRHDCRASGCSIVCTSGDW